MSVNMLPKLKLVGTATIFGNDKGVVGRLCGVIG